MPKFQFKTAKLTILIKQIISRPAGFTIALVNAKFKFVELKNPFKFRYCSSISIQSTSDLRYSLGAGQILSRIEGYYKLEGKLIEFFDFFTK
jgi:hypothetical protein